VRRDEVLAACSRLPGAVEDYPFGDGVAVFKVGGKMFAIVSLGESPGDVSLKCEPELAEALRTHYDSITPGYHLNKRHWNTVALDGGVPDNELAGMIEHSYERVLAGLPRALRQGLE
jgi:predicted DNA-binding protein (MmcQ/YjbR family)